MADDAVFERMVAHLKSRGMSDSAVERARDLWVNVPKESAAWPCPLCAMSGRSGSLTPMGGETLKCRACNEAIKLVPLA
jgi:hypothetical protein